MKYGLTDKQLNSILDTCKQFKEIEEVILFGSRAMNTYKSTSDIDLALKGNISLNTLSSLQAQLEELNIIFSFDVVNYHSLNTPEFLEHIDQYGIKIYLKGWEETTLGEIADIIMGQSPKGNTCNENKIGTPLLNGPTEFGSVHPVPIQYTNEPKKISQVNDLLFCVRGSTTGRMNWSNEKYAIGRGIAAIRHKEGKEYRKYIRGVFDFKLQSLLAEATGSTFPNVSRSQLENINLKTPPLAEQKAIANILTSFDDKIELLQAQNNTLEQTAQTIFKEWFGKYQLDDELPEGWRVFQLDELVNTINGYSYKGKELVEESNESLVTLKSFDRNGGFQTRGFKPFKGEPKDAQEVQIGDLVVAHTDLTQDADVLGNPAFIFDNGGFNKMYITMDLVKVNTKHKDISSSFLYYLMKDKRFKGHCVGYSNGTTVLHLSKKAIPEYKIPLPIDFRKINEFTAIANATTKKISLNKETIKNLKQTRDTLLPKLMSGELRVNILKELS